MRRLDFISKEQLEAKSAYYEKIISDLYNEENQKYGAPKDDTDKKSAETYKAIRLACKVAERFWRGEASPELKKLMQSIKWDTAGSRTITSYTAPRKKTARFHLQTAMRDGKSYLDSLLVTGLPGTERHPSYRDTTPKQSVEFFYWYEMDLVADLLFVLKTSIDKSSPESYKELRIRTKDEIVSADPIKSRQREKRKKLKAKEKAKPDEVNPDEVSPDKTKKEKNPSEARRVRIHRILEKNKKGLFPGDIFAVVRNANKTDNNVVNTLMGLNVGITLQQELFDTYDTSPWYSVRYKAKNVKAIQSSMMPESLLSYYKNRRNVVEYYMLESLLGINAIVTLYETISRIHDAAILDVVANEAIDVLCAMPNLFGRSYMLRSLCLSGAGSRTNIGIDDLHIVLGSMRQINTRTDYMLLLSVFYKSLCSNEPYWQNSSLLVKDLEDYFYVRESELGFKVLEWTKDSKTPITDLPEINWYPYFNSISHVATKWFIYLETKMIQAIIEQKKENVCNKKLRLIMRNVYRRKLKFSPFKVPFPPLKIVRPSDDIFEGRVGLAVGDAIYVEQSPEIIEEKRLREYLRGINNGRLFHELYKWRIGDGIVQDVTGIFPVPLPKKS